MEHDRALREFLVNSANGLGISLTDHQAQQFLRYLSHLLVWNRTTNLTSITDPYEVISKHFIDSLTALSAHAFPLGCVVYDVGSGAGFPGLPLKIVRSDLRVLLIEPSLKKCSFLHFIVGALKLEQVSIYSGGLEKLVEEGSTAGADVLLVRALKFHEIVEAAAAALKANGHVLLFQTENSHQTLPRPFRVESHYGFSLPLNHGERVVTTLTKSVGLKPLPAR